MQRKFNIDLEHSVESIRDQVEKQDFKFSKMELNEFDFDLMSIRRLYARKVVGIIEYNGLLSRLKRQVVQHILEKNNLQLVK